MILEIFSISTRQRVGLINTHKFVQYVEEFCGVGSFSITVPITESSLRFLDKKHFILFEPEVMGVIRYRSKVTEKDSTVEVKGYLINKILEYRSFLKTKTLNGKITDVAREMVEYFFINNEDYRRNIPFIELSDSLKYMPDSPSISTQSTGKTVEYMLESILGKEGYGFSLVPVLSRVDYESGSVSNISAVEFRVHKPSDRSVGNTEGNSPVVFSTSMNNLYSSSYTEDDTEYCSVAVVAGEGEGSSRIIVEVGDDQASGMDRIELYVDARDIQSVTEDEVLTEQEYVSALMVRGSSRLSEHLSYTFMEATAIDGASSYKYGVDFFNGDYVTVIDEEIGIAAKVQITEVTKSSTENGERLDITFGKERVAIQKIIRKRGVL